MCTAALPAASRSSGPRTHRFGFCARDPEARNVRHTYVKPAGDGALWRVQQMLIDPGAHNDWVMELDIDLAASRAQLPSAAEFLTAGQQEWVVHSETLRVDAGDVYHALRALELPPSERLRRGLTRVRVRSHAR